MITPQQAIERLISNNELFYDEMTDLMRQIMSGQVPPEQIAAILTGLRIKVETVSEITAAASVMREFATKVPLENADDLVDIVGTGGDGAKTSIFPRLPCLSRLRQARSRQTRRPLRFFIQRRCRCHGTNGGQPQPQPRTGCPKHSANRHRLYVRAQPPHAPCAMLPQSAARSASAASSISWAR